MAESKKMGIYEKLMTVQQTAKIPKNQFNSFGKYHYRSCEDILEGLKPCLKEVGATVTVNDEIVEIGSRVYVKATARFTDTEGAYIENTAFAREPENKSGMDTAQITGATSSYARKYALNGLFMIDDNKDADTDENKVESDARGKKADKVKTEETEKKLIDEIKQKALMEKCKNSNISVITLLDKCKLKHIEDITEKQYYWLINNWEKFIDGK